MAIRILVVDDHDVVRAGICEILATDTELEVVGQAADGTEALRLAQDLRPEMVLMDVSMPGIDGIEATRRILAAVPGTRVVMLTSYASQDRIVAALDAGAVGYVLKDSEPEHLMRRLHAAAQSTPPSASAT
jgi:DNA-binding NarL/FixJ family response regulator